MELSILVARVISVIYVTAGIAVIMGTVDFNEIVNGLVKSPALTFMTAAVAIVGGIFLVEHHNLWVKNWTVLITLISWMFLIGGIIVMIFPRFLLSYNQFLKNSRLLGSFMLVFGLIIGYFGFMLA